MATLRAEIFKAPVFLAAVFILIGGDLNAQQAQARRVAARYPLSLYTVIDSPTAEVLDYGNFAFGTRFFSKGGLLPHTTFGVFQRLMVGFSMELDNYIGNGDVDLQRPELQVKLRFYDGDRFLPAAAIGYDSQGYRYNKTIKAYREEERGLYLTLTREMLFSGLEWSFGGNISDFKSDEARAFTSASWISPQSKFGLTVEYDNIHHKRWNRLNAGTYFFLSPFVHMGFHVRDTLATKTLRNSPELRRPERVIDIRYITSF
ncbi:MAG: hypothetical protein HY401_10510 [Elusimicrobia bacterium]|nr:hypothetical protein [Elusimicrobiota bacterium]